MNNDGLISSAQKNFNTSSIILKNGLSTADNVELKDINGDAITQLGTDSFKVIKSITNQGFSIFNSSSISYQILVEGKGSNNGKYGIAEVDSQGVTDTENIAWESDDFESLENKFTIDLDNNSLIKKSSGYTIQDNSENLIVIKSSKGITYDDNYSDLWNATYVTETKSGFNILLTGEDSESKNGQIQAWTLDDNGVIQNTSEWKTTTKALEAGWENSYLFDLDNNGLIASNKAYIISTNNKFLKLKSKKGKVLNDASSKNWNAIQAIESNSGYELLLEGATNFPVNIRFGMLILKEKLPKHLNGKQVIKQ